MEEPRRRQDLRFMAQGRVERPIGRTPRLEARLGGLFRRARLGWSGPVFMGLRTSSAE